MSAAIVAHLADGRRLDDAVDAGKAFVTEAIRHALAIGDGIGPVDQLWPVAPAEVTEGDQACGMRVTLSALMQDVQTFTRRGVPSTSARTRWMFGFQRRLFRLCENVTDLPNQGPLPQMSQVAAMVHRGYQTASDDQDEGPIFARPASSDAGREGPGDRLDLPAGCVVEVRVRLAERPQVGLDRPARDRRRSDT